MAKAVAFVDNKSSLLLTSECLETLLQSHGFQLLREHLAQHYAYGLCEKHTVTQSKNLERWLVVRDLLHALLVPIVELFDKACGVAAAVTHATKFEDLEHAFTGRARNAFVWLQCFLSAEKELDWCYSRGCPTCVVGHTLDSEFTVRLLHAACLLSDIHYPFTIEGPTLPSFMFYLEFLRKAVARSNLFPEHFFELLQPKALATRDGVEDLIHQCLELDAGLSQPASPIPLTSPTTTPVMGPMGGTPGMPLKRGNMAKRQLQLKLEEDQWMDQMLKKCCNQLASAASDSTILSSLPDHGALEKTAPAVVVGEMAPA